MAQIEGFHFCIAHPSILPSTSHIPSRELSSNLEWSLTFATSSTSQDSPRQSRSFVNCTSVAYSELVSTSVTVVNNSANLAASSGQSPESPSQSRATTAETQTELGRLDVIRKTLSTRDFQSKQLTSSVRPGQQALRNSIRECGTSGLTGVINSKLIYFKLLSSRWWSS